MTTLVICINWLLCWSTADVKEAEWMKSIKKISSKEHVQKGFTTQTPSSQMSKLSVNLNLTFSTHVYVGNISLTSHKAHAGCEKIKNISKVMGHSSGHVTLQWSILLLFLPFFSTMVTSSSFNTLVVRFKSPSTHWTRACSCVWQFKRSEKRKHWEDII